MVAVKGEPTLIGSVQRALRLLEAVGGYSTGATAKQLARSADLPLPTTYHLLRTLAHEGYLRRVEGVYIHGPAIGNLGRSREQQEQRHAIRRRLAALRDELGAPVYFATFQDGELAVLDVAETSALPAVHEWADFRRTAHAHALGQCLLGQLDQEGRKDYLSRYRPESLTRRTLSAPALFRRFEQHQPGRPVLELQEYLAGTVCAAVPVALGGSVGTVGLSIPAVQAERLPGLAEQLNRRVGTGLSSPFFTI
ncbi:IclR family transcriptional regulator [Streptacidiphilus sp. N1-12]|uniref:IclR family transcriptional regulator n=2 Tax=Streptacidiphilus alkalitolerans TaxID=3342712 RepID=A0ABV6WEQ6_9ACTN